MPQSLFSIDKFGILYFILYFFISSLLGKNTISTLSFFNSFKSCLIVDGYLFKSSFGENWSGFTKMLTIRIAFLAFADFTNDI